MDRFREAVNWAVEGPLSDASEFPTAILYAVVIVFTHTAAQAATQELTAALAERFGAPTKAWRLFGTRLRFPGPPPIEASPGASKITLKLGQRIRPNRLRLLIEELADIPGASDLRLRGERERFAERGSRTGGMVDG
jgi:hypothetical protein